MAKHFNIMGFSEKNIFICLLLILISTNCFSETEFKDPRKIASEKAWQENIMPGFFSEKNIIDSNNAELIIKAPQKAEDAAIVPVSIDVNNDEINSVKTIYVFVDKNPSPLVGIFDFPNSNSKTDIAMRIRVNDYSYIRAIAETIDGKLYMAKSFIKAAGGCSAPAPPSLSKSTGKIKTRVMGKLSLSNPNLLQLKIRHPNYSGLETPLPGQEKPVPYYISNVKAKLDGKLILDFKTTFSISTNPSFRFFIHPKQEGKLEIIATDTKNRVYKHEHILDHNNVSIN